MRCLIIAGSPRAGGNTDFCAGYIRNRLCETGRMEVDILHLYDFHIERCRGCRACMRLKRCVITGDDLARVMERVFAADLIIAAAPVFWNGPPGIMKDLIDRAHGWFAHPGIFRGKQVYIVSPAADGGWDAHESVMTSWFQYYGAEIRGRTRIKAREKGEVENNGAEKAKLDDLASRISGN